MSLFEAEITGSDPAYRNIRDGDHPCEIQGRKLCNILWKSYEPFADPHFKNEIQRDFDARFWEMDLTCAFIEKGYDITCPKPGPDICIDYNDSNIWVEAIAPNRGSGPDQVPEYENIDIYDVPDEQIILRLTAAINEKYNKYRSYLENRIISDNESYIIAINGNQIITSRTDFEPPRIVRTVFPIGNEVITVNVNSREVVETGHEYKPAVIKQNNASIPIDCFLNHEFKGISAVLYSNTDCCNRPINTGEDYILIHNPLAQNPIEECFIKFGREFIAEKSQNSEYQLRQNTYSHPCK